MGTHGSWFWEFWADCSLVLIAVTVVRNVGEAKGDAQIVKRKGALVFFPWPSSLPLASSSLADPQRS